MRFFCYDIYMRFSYTAKKVDGSTYTAVFEGNSKSDLFKEVQKTGASLLTYKETSAKSSKISSIMGSIFSRVKMIDKITFARNLGNMLDAGLSFTRALAVMEKQTKNNKLKIVFQSIGSDISSGRTFYQALQKYPNIFPAFFVFMVNFYFNFLNGRMALQSTLFSR